MNNKVWWQASSMSSSSLWWHPHSNDKLQFVRGQKSKQSNNHFFYTTDFNGMMNALEKNVFFLSSICHSMIHDFHCVLGAKWERSLTDKLLLIFEHNTHTHVRYSENEKRTKLLSWRDFFNEPRIKSDSWFECRKTSKKIHICKCVPNKKSKSESLFDSEARSFYCYQRKMIDFIWLSRLKIIIQGGWNQMNRDLHIFALCITLRIIKRVKHMVEFSSLC